MRSDYALYAVAIILFIITGAVSVYATTQAQDQNLWIVIPAVLGFAFIGLGYTQRPRQEATTEMAVAPPPPPTPPTPKIEVKTEVVEEKKVEPEPVQPVEPVVEVKAPFAGLLEVKGIGEKRSEQLKAFGISSVEELAKASAKDLAAKLRISPKITSKWIENAKEIVKKS